jgi:hypothetical protein
VFALALVTTALYCFSLPLWEGFDEAFHYGYVESIAVDHRIPVLGRTTISKEIRTSLDLAPISFILSRNIPGTTPFERWFALPQTERVDRRARLRAISASERRMPSSLANYEAQQAPLAYLMLAPVDAVMSGTSLPVRILILRLFCALAATALIFFAMLWLCETLGVNGPFRVAALALLFEMQIYEASVAHVGNDWLSITAAAWFFAALAVFVRFHRRREAILLGVVLAAGLLAKAYFLAFVPVFVLVLLAALLQKQITFQTAGIAAFLAAALASPWYVRNLLVYRTLAGMQENVKGVSQQDAWYAFRHIHWAKALVESARRGLWTGNESYLSFSQGTLNVLLLLLLAGFVLYLIRFRKSQSAERWVLFGAGLFVLALIYDLCVAWADTHGLQPTTGPYYTPCILPAVFALTFLGLQRSGMWGRAIAVGISAVALWVGLLTYFAKLLPYYGGVVGRSTPGTIMHWWLTPAGHDIFAVTTLGPSITVYVLLICYTGLLGGVTWLIISSLFRASASNSEVSSAKLPLTQPTAR